MASYTAPLRDMRFIYNELFDSSEITALPGCEDTTPDLVDAVLEEAAKLCQNELFPLNRTGDEEGCQWDNGEVTTPAGFKEAYAKYIEGGWNGLACSPDHGGQGMPGTLNVLVEEMMCSSNMAFGMYAGLTRGAYRALNTFGCNKLKSLYLPRLASGEWCGTMCLTEPQCGTDLGLIRTRAEHDDDGNYALRGTKIFISAGEHDLSSNIIHLVLARLPDAPAGIKGISLFLVPKFLPDENGEPGQRNTVTCASIENKMGIKASATCVMNFDDAKGWLVGEPHKGMRAMFTMMNDARLGVGVQGLGLAEIARQSAVEYARERLQGRSISGTQHEDKPADPIIVHPDVRRMLLTMRAFTEGARAMAAWIARHIDLRDRSTDADTRQASDDMVQLLTPIVKVYFSDGGFEITNLCIQVYGGHGYIRDTGVEQYARDARIAQIYEGANGIQALDLLGRKVLLMTQGGAVREFTLKIANFARKHLTDKRLRPWALELLKLTGQWNLLTVRIMLAARKDRDVVSSAAYDFLMYSGYVTMAYIWLRQAAVAVDKLDNEGEESAGFYQAKLGTTEFYFERLLPRAQSHAASMLSPSKNLMQLNAEDLAFTG